MHGNLSYYRLARLIKYSFYKNITFAFVLFYYQFYNGFSGEACRVCEGSVLCYLGVKKKGGEATSPHPPARKGLSPLSPSLPLPLHPSPPTRSRCAGQSLVDSITAAVYNVVFTSVPILLFAVLDRPVRDFKTYIHYPQLYDKSDAHSLTTAAFWKAGVLLAIVHGAFCFFVPYYSIATSGNHDITDVYSLGKIAFVALLGTVTLEVALIARYWTWLFGIFVFLSYFLVYPYMTIFPLVGAAKGGGVQALGDGSAAGERESVIRGREMRLGLTGSRQTEHCLLGVGLGHCVFSLRLSYDPHLP